jgi:DinB family protein
MDLRAFLVEQHTDVGSRITNQVLARVPVERRDERPCEGSSSIAWLLWHALRHQDVAINAVVRGEGEVLRRDGWAERIGAIDFAGGAGLAEADDRDAAARLVGPELEGYATAVWQATAAWLATVEPDELDRVPDAAAGLRRVGVDAEAYPWLYRMWQDKPVAFFVSWEAIGHGYNHLGEMVHLRNELGLGGF